jgi:hypothetical protein
LHDVDDAGAMRDGEFVDESAVRGVAIDRILIANRDYSIRLVDTNHWPAVFTRAVAIAPDIANKLALCIEPAEDRPFGSLCVVHEDATERLAIAVGK